MKDYATLYVSNKQEEAYHVDNMGVIDAEYFISLTKRDDFDYTIW